MPEKLILLDIFSYSCMNCVRSLKYIKQINRKYKKYGLKTILVHTAEWSFEKNTKNVMDGIKRLKIKFPVKIDKNKKVIRKLNINFWPAQALIKNSKLIYLHIRGGNYKKLENEIRKILKIKSKRIFETEPKYSKFPTVYAGKRKGGKIADLENKLKFGVLCKNGKWLQRDEFLEHAGKQGSLSVLTKGKTIYFVAKSLNKKPINLFISLGNRFLGKLAVNKPQLYKITELKNNKSRKLAFSTKSKLAIYSFSFE